jgi:hypothetical protein
LESKGAEETVKSLQNQIKAEKMRDFPLPDFLSSPCVISGNTGISRIEIVKYVANKLGGVHWDNERGGWTGPTSSKHLFLDEGHLVIGKLPAPLYETLSIAEAVARASDIDKICARVAEIAPEDQAGSNVIRFREGRIERYSDITFNVSNNE